MLQRGGEGLHFAAERARAELGWVVGQQVGEVLCECFQPIVECFCKWKEDQRPIVQILLEADRSGSKEN